ncbi:MAG: hypothetical protein EBZ48_15685 [Proteobacteria bacterium]|nr:hypothetical protein [Pseudomonadota bacterium]
MSVLTNLKLVAAKKPAKQPPVVQRRNKLSNKLWEQLQLARAEMSGETYAPTRRRTVKDPETGLRKSIDVPKRVKPWWFVSETGKVCLSVKYGNKVLELAKGKSAIEVANPDELIKTLETIKAATDSGELDTQISSAAGSLRDGFQK